MVEVGAPAGFMDLDVVVTVAGDVGDMYGDNLGLLISLQREGVF